MEEVYNLYLPKIIEICVLIDENFDGFIQQKEFDIYLSEIDELKASY